MKNVVIAQSGGPTTVINNSIRGAIDALVRSGKTNKIYGAIHQLGGMAGRGHRTKIPARPYLVIQDEDWAEIKEALTDFIIRGKT